MPMIRGARVEPRALTPEAEIRGGAGVTEDQGGAGGKKGAQKSQSDEAQPKERSPEALAG